MQRTLLVIVALGPLGLAGCSSVGSGGGAAGRRRRSCASRRPGRFRPARRSAARSAGRSAHRSATTTARAAWEAQVAALDSGQRRSWRGSHGVFGFVEPGAAAGDGCRAYSQTIYIAGRPNRGHGVGCKQPDGSWKMTS